MKKATVSGDWGRGGVVEQGMATQSALQDRTQCLLCTCSMRDNVNRVIRRVGKSFGASTRKTITVEGNFFKTRCQSAVVPLSVQTDTPKGLR